MLCYCSIPHFPLSHIPDWLERSWAILVIKEAEDLGVFLFYLYWELIVPRNPSTTGWYKLLRINRWKAIVLRFLLKPALYSERRMFHAQLWGQCLQYRSWKSFKQTCPSNWFVDVICFFPELDALMLKPWTHKETYFPQKGKMLIKPWLQITRTMLPKQPFWSKSRRDKKSPGQRREQQKSALREKVESI